MALTLRQLIGRKLTVQEADGNLIYLQTLANNAQSSADSLDVRVTDLETEIGSIENNFVSKAGDTITGAILYNGTPTQAIELVNKAYVDGVVNSISWKRSVSFATNAALPSYTFSSNVLTATANGQLTVDGSLMSDGDRILVKNEPAGTKRQYNGIYIVTDAGSAGSKWILTRATDADTSAELLAATTYVRGGSVEIGRVFTVTNQSISINVTEITFALIAGVNTYQADGNTLDLTGQVFSVNTTNEANRIRATLLTGLSLATNAVISATDSILSALGKLQKQITDLTTTVNSNTSSISSLSTNKADKSTTISAGYGLTGGGDLSANRTLAVSLTDVETEISTTVASSATADTLITGRVLTLPAGTWRVVVSMRVEQTSVQSLGTCRMFFNGVAQANTIRTFGCTGSGLASVDQDRKTVHMTKKIVSPGGQDVSIRASHSQGSFNFIDTQIYATRIA